MVIEVGQRSGRAKVALQHRPRTLSAQVVGIGPAHFQKAWTYPMNAVRLPVYYHDRNRKSLRHHVRQPGVQRKSLLPQTLGLAEK